jgi:hypothetical protein
MLNIFSPLAAGEKMPAREKTRARRLYARLGSQQAVLLPGAVIATRVRECSRQWHSGSLSRADDRARSAELRAGR